jgi:hypothetical protein
MRRFLREGSNSRRNYLHLFISCNFPLGAHSRSPSYPLLSRSSVYHCRVSCVCAACVCDVCVCVRVRRVRVR